MSSSLPPTSLLDSIPALRVLEGLARLHQTVLAVDAEGRIVWASDALGVLCGRAGRGTPAAQLFVDPAQMQTIGRSMRDSGRVADACVDLRRPDGGTAPVEVSGVRISTEDSKAPLHVFIVRSLDQAGRQAQRIHRMLEHLREILENSPTPVLALDAQGFISYANPAVESLLGHGAAGLRGKPLAVLVQGDRDVERVAATLCPGAEVRTMEVELAHVDGTPLRVSVSVGALPLPEDGEAGTVLTLHDVTEDRRAREELLRRNAELEHYVHAVSHDLRSPLVSLLGFSRLLRQEYGEQMDETGRHFLERIEQASRRMEALINDLLELSRMSEPSDRRAAVDVHLLLRHLQAELKPRLEAEGVALEVPEGSSTVYADRNRLYQVLVNLIGNALDHMGPCPDPRVSVEVREEPEKLHVTVRDNGRGIHPDDHARIFQMFQSLGPRTDGSRGTGIGLSIVKKTVETQGGVIRLESAPGHGAAFHVTLPRS